MTRRDPIHDVDQASIKAEPVNQDFLVVRPVVHNHETADELTWEQLAEHALLSDPRSAS